MGATTFMLGLHQLRPVILGFQCQFQVLEISVEGALQSAHLGTGMSQDQTSWFFLIITVLVWLVLEIEPRAFCVTKQAFYLLAILPDLSLVGVLF